MPYTPGASLASGPYSAGGTQTYQQANNAEIQYQEATLSFEPDLFTAFVFDGLVPTKDGTTASQLDVTSGKAFVTQSDGTLRQRTPTATTFSTASHPSTTMYLDLQPDGTWSWATAHSGVSGYLAVAQVTVDASGNIASVTDERVTTIAFFPGTTNIVSFVGGDVLLGPNASGGVIASRQSGAASGLIFQSWTGSAAAIPFSVGGRYGGATTWVDNTTGYIGVTTAQGGLVLDGTALNGDSGYAVFIKASNPGGNTGNIDLNIQNSTSGNIYFYTKNGVAHVDHNGLLYSGGGLVAVQGAHSGVTPSWSAGNGAPASLAANEIYVQLT